MIIGRKFAEKCFSQVDESEKLFSTGNEELDAILEEVYYSGIEDGYDYAQKEFSEKSKPRLLDKVEINKRRKIYNGRKGNEILESHLKQTDKDPNVRDKELKEATKKLRNQELKTAAIGIPAAALGGAALGKYLSGSPVEGAKQLGAAYTYGTLAGAAGNEAEIAIIKRNSRKAAEGDKKAKKKIEKSRDWTLVASGKMTEEKFIKKWGGKIDGKKIKGSENE